MSIQYPVSDLHVSSSEEVLKIFETNPTEGLTQSEAEKRTQSFGLNIYETQKAKSIWRMLIEQFKSPIVYILLAGTCISVYFSDYIEAIAILVVILINALIGFLMELQARSSMNALKEMDVIQTRVIREGKSMEIPAEKLTPGDIVLLEAGDVIPGDGRVIESNQLQCDESALTGESLPSAKEASPLPKETALGDRHNMVFKGSSVMNGTGKAVITGIARNTELGTITSLVENAGETSTPLDKKLNVLSKKLIWVTLSMTVLFGITGFIQQKQWGLILKTSIALAVAAIPEGLPIVSTIALAYGMLFMAKRNAIVKKLSAVETLGSTNVILTDKTGTLTENKIYVDTLAFPEEQIKIQIEGESLQFPEGTIQRSEENFEKLKFIGTLCNNAYIKENDHMPSGDPIEIALMVLCNASGGVYEEIRTAHKRLLEIPFNSDAKIMGTLNQTGETQFVSAKGSVEHLLNKCSKIQRGTSVEEISQDELNTILTASETMAAEGLRVLAFAYKEHEQITEEDFLQELIYVGMIGFLDPPRTDIKEAISSCRKAGIKIIMVTGDHPMTALNIAKKTGLVDEKEENVINGKDIPEAESLSEEWKQKILSTSVFARTTPKQKLEITDIYQQENYIVAMTGDGVNDAPALKKSDIGIAMGLRGTQVAKETASIVLKDDSFTSISAAVAHGRAIFQNIQKFVVYLVSCNLSEIFIVISLGFFAHASTLLPLQILFLNMVTDVFPALALGLGKGDETVMDRPPRDPRKDLITSKQWLLIVIDSMIITLAVIGAVVYCRTIHTDDTTINNVAFLTLALSQLVHVFNMSSLHSGFIFNDVTKNKFIWLAILLCTGSLITVFAIPQLREVLNLTPLPLSIWGIALTASMFPLVVLQVYKLVYKLTHKH